MNYEDNLVVTLIEAECIRAKLKEELKIKEEEIKIIEKVIQKIKDKIDLSAGLK